MTLKELSNNIKELMESISPESEVVGLVDFTGPAEEYESTDVDVYANRSSLKLGEHVVVLNVILQEK